MTEGSSDPIRTRVGELINAHGSVRAAAKAIGIESSYLFRLSTGEKSSPSDATLAKLGMKRVITFERIQQPIWQATGRPAMPDLAYRAMMFAREVHAGQERKYTGNPYTDHLAEVAGIVGTVANTDEMGEGGGDIAIAVSWLHDCVEDQGITEQELGSQFGMRVARGVMLLSDLEVGNRAVRKSSEPRATGASAEMDSNHQVRRPHQQHQQHCEARSQVRRDVPRGETGSSGCDGQGRSAVARIGIRAKRSSGYWGGKCYEPPLPPAQGQAPAVAAGG